MSEDTIAAVRGRHAAMSRLRRVLLAAALCVVLVTCCIAYIDQPVEVFVYQHMQYRLLFQALASPSLVSLPLACIYLLVCGVRALSGRWPDRAARLYLQLSFAVVMATSLKDELKFLFGRPWPKTWILHGIYGFHPFTSGELFGCFPSGHTTYIAAPMCVLWVYVPRYRALWAGLIVIVVVGLVGAGYHYIGDTIAGFFTGLAAAAATMALMPLSVAGYQVPVARKNS